MSEEEIIERLKRIIKIAYSKEFTTFELTYQDVDAIQGLLDLYNKQQNEIEELKENNKTKVDIRDVEFSNFIKERYISKDIIRKIIKELSDQNYNNYELSVALSKSLEALLK